MLNFTYQNILLIIFIGLIIQVQSSHLAIDTIHTDPHLKKIIGSIQLYKNRSLDEVLTQEQLNFKSIYNNEKQINRVVKSKILELENDYDELQQLFKKKEKSLKKEWQNRLHQIKILEQEIKVLKPNVEKKKQKNKREIQTNKSRLVQSLISNLTSFYKELDKKEQKELERFEQLQNKLRKNYTEVTQKFKKDIINERRHNRTKIEKKLQIGAKKLKKMRMDIAQKIQILEQKIRILMLKLKMKAEKIEKQRYQEQTRRKLKNINRIIPINFKRLKKL